MFHSCAETDNGFRSNNALSPKRIDMPDHNTEYAGCLSTASYNTYHSFVLGMAGDMHNLIFAVRKLSHTTESHHIPWIESSYLAMGAIATITGLVPRATQFRLLSALP